MPLLAPRRVARDSRLQSAIALIHKHPLSAAGRVTAAVGDLTSGALPAELAACLGRCDGERGALERPTSKPPGPPRPLH